MHLDNSSHIVTSIRHWLPILTICPHNGLPDLIYIEIAFENRFEELYRVRREIRKLVRWKKMYMEDIAKMLAARYPSASRVQVSLLFSRHVVTIHPGE